MPGNECNTRDLVRLQAAGRNGVSAAGQAATSCAEEDLGALLGAMDMKVI